MNAENVGYLGDFAAGQTVHFKWNTAKSTGESITRGTNGTIYVYKDDETGTEVTTGVTDTEDFDTNIGVHHCKIVLADAFYAAGHEYTVVLKAAVIDLKTLSSCLAQFSIQNRNRDIALGQVNTSDNDATHVGGQLRRMHALAGGTVAQRNAAAANPTWVHRNEVNGADLVTRTRTTAGTIETETPT